MSEHPNDFTRYLIGRFLAKRNLAVKVAEVQDGYVIFSDHFSAVEGRSIEEPSGRLLFDRQSRRWKLYWISSTFRWHLYNSYPRLFSALEVLSGDQAANLFRNCL